MNLTKGNLSDWKLLFIFASMKDILRLIRPKQWLKNVFVLVPMFFGGALTDGATVYASVVTFVAFCFMASAVLTKGLSPCEHRLE